MNEYKKEKNYRSISNEIEKIARLLRKQVRLLSQKNLKEKKIKVGAVGTIGQVAKLLRQEIKKKNS